MSRPMFARRRGFRPSPARRTLAVLLTLLTTLAGPASLALAAPRQQTQAATTAAPVSSKSGYNDNVLVIYRDEEGGMACREATAAEKQAINAARRNPSGDDSAATRIIYTGGGGRSFVDENGEIVASPSVTETGTPLLPSVGLRIVLHGTQQLENNPTAKSAFIVAANRWESLISTPITVVLDVDYGTTFFGSPFGSGVLGATSSSSQGAPLSTVRTQLLNNVPEPEEAQLYNALPSASVPVELNGSTTSVSSVRMTFPVARALGLRADITNPDAVMQGDARIGFNSALSFDFTPDNGITPGQLDFDAVVVHEIGHALGFTSESGDGIASPVGMWDLFRFRPGAATLASFPNAPRVMSEGGSQVFFNNRTNSFNTTELALSTGGSDGEGGDGEQSSHWKDDRFTAFIGIMDPTLSSGRREVITDNDLKAIDTFGYKIGGVAPPPPPPPAAPPNDNFANAVLLSGSTGSVTGTNVGATAQAGEPDPSSGTGPGARSVWYFWTAPASGSTTFDTIGSDYDTTLGAYTGGGFPLNIIAQNDDIVLAQNIQSRINFNAVAGTTYRIMVNGFDSDTGHIVLNWTAPGGQPTTFRISGRVTDNFGAIVDAATVRLFNAGGALITQTATDSLGNYAFTGVASGSYTLDVSKAGYNTQAAQVNNLTADQTVNLVLPVAPFTVSGLFRDTQNNVITGAGYTVSNVANTIFGADPATGAYSVTISPTAAAPVTITPVKYGYTFAPASVSFNTTSAGNQTVNFVGTLNNPIDASALFVTQHYRDFLGREPDAPGLDFWRNGIEACGPLVPCTEVNRVNTSAAFFLSIEFQETGVLVYRMWKTAYANAGDTPIPVRRADFLADTALVGQNVQVGVGNWQQQLEDNKAAYANTFASRQVFKDKYDSMTNEQYVAALNVNAEGALSATERQTLIDALNNQTMTRAQVLRAVAEDETLRQSQLRRAFVLMQYFGYLRRDPDAPDFRGIPDPQFLGYNFWLGKLNEFNGNYEQAEMVKAFITSIEYRQRFGQ